MGEVGKVRKRMNEINKVKFIFISPGYYPHIGGMEYVIKSIVERLVKMGHEVTVIAGEPDIDEPREEEINGVKIIRWPTWTPSGAYHFPKRRKELEMLLKNVAEKVDIVHVHSIHTIFTVNAGMYVADLAPKAKLVVTTYYHGSGHSTFRNLAWILWRKKVSRFLKRAEVIHALSKRERSFLVSHYPEIKEKITVIPSGVDEDVISYKWKGQESNYIIYAGRVEKYKRLDLALEIAKEMGLRLLIVGKGSYRDIFKKNAEREYGGSVEFLEPQPRNKYLELLSNARYAINLSQHESFSLFTAEAITIGVPTITSREIVENLEAIAKPFKRDLFVIHSARIYTWNDILSEYMKKIYRC